MNYHVSHPADATELARACFDAIQIEERLIDAAECTLETNIFGHTFHTPIMMAAFSHFGAFGEGRESGLMEYTHVAYDLNMVNWVGMMENSDYAAIAKSGAQTIRIIKPYADRDKVFSQIAFAREQGALAVGMDIDHIFGTNGKYDVVVGEKMARQTLADLKAYVEAAQIPFVVKGVLSTQDALKCAEAGVKGIVVSHHHGRIPFAVPPLAVLPKIKEALKDSEISIFLDCAVSSGADAFKALALGADAVSIGRVTIPILQKEGMEGLKKMLNKTNEELATLMNFTGCAAIKEINDSLLWM